MNYKSSSFSEVNFSVIIPNYNGSNYIPNCLNSLIEAIKFCPLSKFELIFIDNGSKDESLKIAQNITRNIFIFDTSYIILKTNHGFANAVNKGINKAKYSYVVILNNDLTMEPNWFKLIANTIQKNQDPQITTFFGTVLNKAGTRFESQGLDFKIQGKCLNISNGLPFDKSTFDQSLSKKLCWGASASLIVYKKEIIKKIDLFDDDFFAYEEDVDLSFRLHQLGYKTLYVPTALSYHLGGGTSNKMGNFRARMDAKNWIFLIIKNYSATEFWTNFIDIFIERLRNLSGLIKNTIYKYKLMSIVYLPYDILKTYGQVIIKIPKMLKKRYRIKKLLKSINIH